MKSWLSRASQEEICKLHMVTYRRHFERLKRSSSTQSPCRDFLYNSDTIPISFRHSFIEFSKILGCYYALFNVAFPHQRHPKMKWIWFHKLFVFVFYFIVAQYVRKISVTSRTTSLLPLVALPLSLVIAAERKALVWQFSSNISWICLRRWQLWILMKMSCT